MTDRAFRRTNGKRSNRPARYVGDAGQSGYGSIRYYEQATIFDGISRHSPEGLNFKAGVEDVG